MKPSKEHIPATLALFREMPGLREPGTNEYYEAIIEAFLSGKSVDELREAGCPEGAIGAAVLLRGQDWYTMSWRYRELDGSFDEVKIVHALWWLACHERPLSAGAKKSLKGWVAPLAWDLPNPFGLWLLGKCAELSEVTVEELFSPVEELP